MISQMNPLFAAYIIGVMLWFSGAMILVTVAGIWPRTVESEKVYAIASITLGSVLWPLVISALLYAIIYHLVNKAVKAIRRARQTKQEVEL